MSISKKTFLLADIRPGMIWSDSCFSSHILVISHITENDSIYIHILNTKSNAVVKLNYSHDEVLHYSWDNIIDLFS
jgi:hypothetical protein